ncbi:MAG TPA: AMP-dependent synthetase/ligase [Kofleriaceae bacterium]|jgi:long-chain acyl-CoA synthetase
MDVSSLLELKPAPRFVFDRLATHRDRPRFQVRKGTAWEPVTWGQFASQIRGVARWLIERDVQPGDRIAIFGDSSVAWASVSLGVQTTGAMFVPIYPASTPDQVAYILDHSEAKFIFVAGTKCIERLEKAKSLLSRSIEIVDMSQAPWTDAAARDAAEPNLVDTRLAAIDLDAVAEMLYTSGTSGNPKGVPLTHRNVCSNGRDWYQVLAPLLEEGYRDICWLPMSHIFGFGELCVGNALAWETYLTTPAEVLDLLPQVAPNVFFSVPAYWEKIARAMQSGGGTPAEALKRVTGGNLKFCLSGGAGLKVEIKQFLHAAGLLVIEGYGLTETSPTLTMNHPAAFRFDTVGKVFPSVQLKLDDDGEILAKGENVFKGYFKDPEASAACFTPDGWFRTGDVGRWTEDGFLQIIDRKKDILVTAGGKNVPPANIEARFVDDPVIERVVVYGDARSYLVAAIWVRPDALKDAAPEERQQAISSRVETINAELARHETIKRFFVAETPLTVEDGLLTSSLKLRRKAVYERMRDRFEALYA